MSDDLRNRVALAVEGMDTSTVEGARAVADAALAEMGGVRVKPLVWDVVHQVLHQSARNILGKYICSKTNNAHNDRYMVTYLTPTASSETIGYIDGIEAAKAAAQADYEARILAAIEPAPVSVREAARVLLDWTDHNVNGAGQDFADDIGTGGIAALRAIAGGKE